MYLGAAEATWSCVRDARGRGRVRARCGSIRHAVRRAAIRRPRRSRDAGEHRGGTHSISEYACARVSRRTRAGPQHAAAEPPRAPLARPAAHAQVAGRRRPSRAPVQAPTLHRNATAARRPRATRCRRPSGCCRSGLSASGCCC